ncbi:hypothetical protein GBA52_012464 [Prunus armeniaca]|nr:hypothetical protein GBA52_012464 [Prunus armeniaca]
MMQRLAHWAFMFRSKDSKPDHKRHVPIRRKSSRRFVPLFRKSKDALRRRSRKKRSRSKGRVNRESEIHKFRSQFSPISITI